MSSGIGIDLGRLTPEWLREYADLDPEAEDAPDRADAEIMRACADKIERLEFELRARADRPQEGTDGR